MTTFSKTPFVQWHLSATPPSKHDILAQYQQLVDDMNYVRDAHTHDLLPPAVSGNPTFQVRRFSRRVVGPFSHHAARHALDNTYFSGSYGMAESISLARFTPCACREFAVRCPCSDDAYLCPSPLVHYLQIGPRDTFIVYLDPRHASECKCFP